MFCSDVAVTIGLCKNMIFCRAYNVLLFVVSGNLSLHLQEQEQLSYSSTRTKNPSVVVTGLRPSTVYVFHVRARTAAGYTAYSPSFQFATAAEGMIVEEWGMRELCLGLCL